MEKNNDGFFCSQPAPKSAKITDKNWRRVRRPSIVDVSVTSSCTHSGGPEEVDHVERPQQTKIFAFEVEESRNWSKDAVDFYNNGDAPFCHTRFITKPLDRNFWDALLGFESNWCLSSVHVEAWTFRMMRVRQSRLLKYPSEEQRWTVLPPDFYVHTKDANSLVAREMAGDKEPYPPFWEVDYVYLPLWIQQSDWLLVRIDMRTMVITQYWTDTRWRNEKRRYVAYYIEVITLFFAWFLDAIHYWTRSTHHMKYEISVGLVEIDVPQDNGNFSTVGVLFCMMMENLVRNKSLLIEDDVEEACVRYRHHMANQLYRWRCI